MKFIADNATYDMINGAHVAGLAIGDGANGYLMLQRSGEEDRDDLGIYIELNGQTNSNYGIIRECRVSRNAIEIDLNEPLAGVTAIYVTLAVDDVAFSRFVEGIRRVFRNCHSQLKIMA